MTRSTAPSFQPKQSNHGYKRKGKPVEAWMLELEKAQDEENGSYSLDLNAIEQIADGVEQMVFSWGLDKHETGQEYAKLSRSLAKENSHVLLTWSINKRDKALDSASESEHIIARNDQNEIKGNGTPLATHLDLPRAQTSIIGIERRTPISAQAKQRGNFDNPRKNSTSPRREDSENPHPLKAGSGALQGKHDRSKFLLSDSCHGVLTSSNRMRTCPTQTKCGAPHDFHNRASEGSICQAMTMGKESMGGSKELETTGTDSIARKRHIVLHREKVDLWPNRDEVLPIWITEAAPPSPKRVRQREMTNRTRNEFLPLILTHEEAVSVSPLMSKSQSPLYAQAGSPQARIALGSEVSNVYDGLVTRLTNSHEDRPDGFISPLPLLDASPCCGEDTESVAAVKLLRKEQDRLKPSPTADIEELQIALLECAMEYEIKTIEAKMQMQGLKLKGQQGRAVAKSEHPCPLRVIEQVPACDKAVDNQRLHHLKKQMAKLQHERCIVSNDLHALKKKERQFQRQKRSLEDALLRVNRLQREVVKKDKQVVEWQLKEKETKVQLQDINKKLNRERHTKMLQPLQPRKLLMLLPTLRECLRSVKKVPCNVDSFTRVDIYHE